MVKVGDRVRTKPGVIEGEELIGVVEHISDRYELRPYTHLVEFDGYGMAFTEDELEVVDGPGAEE